MAGPPNFRLSIPQWQSRHQHTLSTRFVRQGISISYAWIGTDEAGTDASGAKEGGRHAG